MQDELGSNSALAAAAHFDEEWISIQPCPTFDELFEAVEACHIAVEEAHRWGLVNRIVPAADLMSEARKMADELASGPPLVFAAIKEIAREAEDMKFQDVLNRINGSQFETVERLYRSEDQKEGARAFAEKRDPVWKGR